MKVKRFFEFKDSDITEPIKSFKLKDELNPKLWTNDELVQEVRSQLLEIANDFYNTLEVDAPIKDIILTGSLCNFNYSEKYSDFDLHVLIDLKDVNEDVDLVKKYVDQIKVNWNTKHDIKIKGYDVELYTQDVNETHTSTGVFSLLNNKWLVKPEKKNFKIDEELIYNKSKAIMLQIEDLENEVNKLPYDEFKEQLDKVWDRIKNFRKQGLEESGEMSTGNLVFKLLRRNGSIERVVELKRKSYDQKFQ